MSIFWTIFIWLSAIALWLGIAGIVLANIALWIYKRRHP